MPSVASPPDTIEPAGSDQQPAALSGRERLLSAAVAQFAAKGYVATSVRDIVRAAGVTAPALYYHFGSKEGLFLTLAREAVARVKQVRAEALAAGGGPVDRIRRLCRAHATIRRRYASLSWIVDQILSGPPEAAPAFDFRGLARESLRLFEDLVAEGIAAGELRGCSSRHLALALMGTVEVVVRADVFGVADGKLDESLEGMLDLVLAGAAPPPTSAPVPAPG
ncbi:MAG: TetR/AcrR family transcriptional regulator [Thermoanaerobaculia bacterium]|nr:TetR/AcrR family transcriptional regulator [Thermoanaerobaculia bacterium]